MAMRVHDVLPSKGLTSLHRERPAGRLERPASRLVHSLPDQIRRSRFRTLKEGSFRLSLFAQARQITEERRCG